MFQALYKSKKVKINIYLCLTLFILYSIVLYRIQHVHVLTSGVHILNWVFAKGPFAPEISNSGMVFPKDVGFCSETSIGTFKSFKALICEPLSYINIIIIVITTHFMSGLRKKSISKITNTSPKIT